MTDTYSSAYGGTPQGTALQSINDALSSIKGQIPTQQDIQSTMSNVKAPYQQAGQQGQDMMTKIAQMYIADQNMSGKFMAPGAGNPVPQAQPGQTLQQMTPDMLPAMATPQSIGNFQGFTDPLIAAQAGAAQVSSASDTLRNIATLTGMNYDELGKALNDTASMYSKKIDAIYGMADKLGQMAYDAYSKSTMTPYEAGQLSLAARDQALKEFQAGYTPGQKYPSGTTPNDYADKFMGGYLKWSEIPDQYKQVVTALVKQRGGTVQKVIDGYTGVENSVANLKKIQDAWNKMSETEKRLPTALVNAIPGLSASRAGITSLFYTGIEGELRKAMVGGRVTQQEINWIRNAIIPGPLDTYDSAKQKIDAVLYGLQQKEKNPNYTMDDSTATESKYIGNTNLTDTGGGSSNDPLGIR